MKDNSLKIMKAEALYSVYKEGLRAGRFSSLVEAGKWAAAQPAPCFFVSSKYASILVGELLSGKTRAGATASSRRLALCLHRRYMDYLEAHPGSGLTRERVMEIIVDEPAPEFFISGDGARRMLRRVIRKVREGWGG